MKKHYFFGLIFICAQLLFCYNLEAKSKIHVIGDSHAWEFNHIPHCVIHSIGPITMHRIGRDELEILNFKDYEIQEGDTVVLAFGEIDARCHIGKQRDLKKRTLDEILDVLVYNYLNTILLNKESYQNIRVIGYTVTPPSDLHYNESFPTYGPIDDRITISKLLNYKLIEVTSSYGIEVIDVYHDYADSRGALVPSLSDGTVHINPSLNGPIRKKLSAIMRAKKL